MQRLRALTAVAAIVLASCVSSGGDPARLVPEDAYAAVVVESPASLFRSAQSFFRAAGLDRFTKGRSLEELFRDETKGKESIQEALEVLDFRRPVVLTVVPDRRGSERTTGTVLWLPLRKDKDSFQRLRSAMTGFEGDASFVDGYAALGLEGSAPSALPSRTADLGGLSAYPTDSVKAWIHVEALLRDFPKRWESALKEALRIGDGADSPETGAEEAADGPYNYNERHFDREEYERGSGGSGLAAAGIVNGAAGTAALLEKAAGDIRTLDLALGVDERGFFLRAGAVPRPDGALGTSAAAAGQARGIPYLKYLEADALAGGAVSLDPGILSGLARLYMEALGLGNLMGSEYFDLLQTSYASLGPDSAFSFDITVDSDFLEKADRAQSPGEISELLGRSLSFEAAGAGSLRDRQAYRSVLKRLGDENLFGAAFRELLASSGLTLGIKASEGETEGVPYDSIRIQLGGRAPGTDPLTRAVLDVLTEKLTLYVGYSTNRYYTVLGNPAKLSEAVRRDEASRPISGDPAYAAFSKTLPRDTRGVYYLSLRRIFGLVSAFSKDRGKVPDQGLDRLYGYFAAARGRLETGIFLGSGDIRALAGLVPEGRGTEPAVF